MRKFKWLAILMLVCFSIFASGCNGSNQNNSTPKADAKDYLNEESQFPIVKEPITLRYMAVGGDFENVYIFKKYEEMTNINIEWDMVPYDGANEVINLSFASDNLPDAYFKCALSLNRQIRYGSEGQLLNLAKDDLLKKYAPNFYAYMNENPDVKASQTFEDGSIYSIPACTDHPATRIFQKLFFNTKWLKAVGKSFPKTTDELYDVLVAFRDKDPNGNGKKDEVPLAAYYDAVMTLCKGWFGLQNRGSGNTDFDMDEETGKLRLIATAPQYRALLEYVKKLYQEKLVSQEMFTMNSADTAALVNLNEAGAYTFTNLGIVSNSVVDDWEGAEPITGPFGDSIWAGTRSHMHSTGAFVITTACKYPEAALRWVDYFFSDEGNLFYHYGVEGETFVKKSDGTYSFTDDILSKVTGTTSFDEVVANYTPYGGGNNPTIMKYPYFCGAETHEKSLEAAAKIEKCMPKETWPLFNFTIDENLEYDLIIKDISSYVSQSSGEFITGRVPLNDNTWNAYIQKIKSMGADRALELATKAYNRAKAVMSGN